VAEPINVNVAEPITLLNVNVDVSIIWEHLTYILSTLLFVYAAV